MVDQEVVTEERTPRTTTVVDERPTVESTTRVVEESAPTYVRRSDPLSNSIAASSLIQTVVWAAVVIVAVVVGILVLVHYNII